MVDTSPVRALTVVKRIVEMCDFIQHPAIEEAIEREIVPVTMPRVVNAVVDMSVWVGLGTVGLWAALDAFADRAGLTRSACPICGRWSCIWTRFAQLTTHPLQGNEGKSLEELEDIRHLYAHNYAGEADAEYLGRRRHVLVGTTTGCDHDPFRRDAITAIVASRAIRLSVLRAHEER